MDTQEERDRRWQEIQKEWEADYQEYLEWSKTFEPDKDNQADTFMFIMFWWVPFVPMLFLARWLGWLN
jgi:hypothetical protein